MWDELKNEITNWLEVRRNRKLNRLRAIRFGRIGYKTRAELALAVRILMENKA